MEADSSTAASPVAVIAFTSIEDETECPLIRTIEIYDEIVEQWDAYDETISAMTTKYPWIDTSSIDNDSGFDVVTEDFTTYDDETIPPTVYQMRQTVEDPNSNESESKIFDNFDVTLKYECDDDVLTLTGPGDIPTQEYQLDSGVQTYAANIAQSVAGCLIVEDHEIWDEQLQSWVAMTTTDFTWLDSAPADGAFDVNQAWHADFVPYQDFLIRITYKSFYSQQSEADMIKTDQYWLRIGDVCEHDTLTKNSEFADWLFDIFSTRNADSKQPDYTQLASKVGTCPLTAKLYFHNDSNNDWDEMTTLWPTYTTHNDFIATSTDDPPTAGTFKIHFIDPETYPAVKPFKEWPFVKITL